MVVTEMVKGLIRAMSWVSEKHPFEAEAQNHYVVLFRVLRMWGLTAEEIEGLLREEGK